MSCPILSILQLFFYFLPTYFNTICICIFSMDEKKIVFSCVKYTKSYWCCDLSILILFILIFFSEKKKWKCIRERERSVWTLEIWKNNNNKYNDNRTHSKLIMYGLYDDMATCETTFVHIQINGSGEAYFPFFLSLDHPMYGFSFLHVCYKLFRPSSTNVASKIQVLRSHSFLFLYLPFCTVLCIVKEEHTKRSINSRAHTLNRPVIEKCVFCDTTSTENLRREIAFTTRVNVFFIHSLSFSFHVLAFVVLVYSTSVSRLVRVHCVQSTPGWCTLFYRSLIQSSSMFSFYIRLLNIML